MNIQMNFPRKDLKSTEILKNLFSTIFFFPTGKCKCIRWKHILIVKATLGGFTNIHTHFPFIYIVNISLLSHKYRHCLGPGNVAGQKHR